MYKKSEKKNADVRVLGGAVFFIVGKFQYIPKRFWIHPFVVPMFQGPWFISGIRDLMTVKFQQKIIKRLADPLLLRNASSEFGTYSLCEQRRFRRACASAQSRQNCRCSLIQAMNQEEPSDRKPDPWSLWMAGHAELKFVITECSKTQIRLTGLTDEMSLTLVREVTDTDRRLTVRDTAEMRDL